MPQSNETARTLLFLGCTAAAVPLGVWYEWLWRLHAKRSACPHLDTEVTWNGAFLGGHQWSCKGCGKSRPATNDEVERLQDEIEAAE